MNHIIQLLNNWHSSCPDSCIQSRLSSRLEMVLFLNPQKILRTFISALLHTFPFSNTCIFQDANPCVCSFFKRTIKRQSCTTNISPSNTHVTNKRTSITFIRRVPFYRQIRAIWFVDVLVSVLPKISLQQGTKTKTNRESTGIDLSKSSS